MAITKGDQPLLLKLLVAITLGAFLGMYLGSNADSEHSKIALNVVVSLRHIIGQIILFLLPLMILGFITPTIVRFGKSASSMLFTAVGLSYLSSLFASIFSMAVGCLFILGISLPTGLKPLRSLPDLVLQLDIPPIFSVMSALVLAILFGVATAMTRSRLFAQLFNELENIARTLIDKVFLPLLPYFVGLSFLTLAYEGLLSFPLSVFISLVLVVICCHVIWLVVLYSIGGLVSGRNPFEVIRHYLPACLTAIGTMSSVATLPVSLACARKSRVLSRPMTEFIIPLGATMHLCGCVIAMTFCCMMLHLMLYGSLPAVGTMLIFCALLGIFVLNAPGVPGGAVVASMGIVTGLLGFDANGIALLIAVFALQDSFGTVCNVLADGALALTMEGIYNRRGEVGPMQTGDEEDEDRTIDVATAIAVNAFVAPDLEKDDRPESKSQLQNRLQNQLQNQLKNQLQNQPQNQL